MQQVPNGGKVSMRHLYLYAYLLLDEANRQGRKVRLVWGSVPTASICPDPEQPNGLLLTLPEMAAVGTEDDAVLLRAVISHEILCHGHHTDFGVEHDEGIGGVLTNALEDPRGELACRKEYPGSRKVIGDGIEVLVRRKVFEGPKAGEELHPAEILTSWLVTELRSEVLGQQCLTAMSLEYRKLAMETFGSRLTAVVKAEALKATVAASTGEVKTLSRKIVEILNLALQNPPPPPSQGQGDPADSDQGQGEDGQDDAQGGGADGDAGKQPGESEGSTEQAGEGDHAASGKSTRTVQAKEPDQAALAKAIQAVLAADAEDAGPHAKGLEDHLVACNEAMKPGAGSSHTHEMGDEPVTRRKSDDNRAIQRAAAKTTAAALALRMAELLEARTLVQRSPSCEGKLRTSRLSRVVLGDLNVHIKRSRVEELDTCVEMLVDESASMDEPFGDDMKRKEAATRVTVAAGEVLNDAEVSFGLTGYNTLMREYQPMDGAWAETLKSFMPTALGSTNTHLAVVRTLRKLISCSQERKVLVTVTDGDPGDIEVLEAALNEARAFGVEARFVLISNEYESQYKALNAAYGVANTPKQLAQAVFGSLEAALA